MTGREGAECQQPSQAQPRRSQSYSGLGTVLLFFEGLQLYTSEPDTHLSSPLSAKCHLPFTSGNPASSDPHDAPTCSNLPGIKVVMLNDYPAVTSQRLSHNREFSLPPPPPMQTRFSTLQLPTVDPWVPKPISLLEVLFKSGRSACKACRFYKQWLIVILCQLRYGIILCVKLSLQDLSRPLGAQDYWDQRCRQRGSHMGSSGTSAISPKEIVPHGRLHVHFLFCI